LLDGTYIVKYNKSKTLQWGGHVVGTDNSRILENYWIENSVAETSGKTTSEMGKQH